MIRLNKYLAQNNIASRRKSDEFVQKGKVLINGKKAKMGDLVDETKDIVSVFGKEIYPSEEKVHEYYILNKPARVLSSALDDRGRKTVVDFVPSSSRLFPVGRLDYMSTGLILLTTDGDLALKITHPKFHVPKKYIVKTKEPLSEEKLKILARGGLKIYDKRTSKTDVTKINSYEFTIVLYEGIKRQIRESCRALDLTVLTLKRISIGELELGKLPLGSYRVLTPQEALYIQGIKEFFC